VESLSSDAQKVLAFLEEPLKRQRAARPKAIAFALGWFHRDMIAPVTGEARTIPKERRVESALEELLVLGLVSRKLRPDGPAWRSTRKI